MSFHNKVVFVLGKPFSLVYCLWARAGAYLRVEHLIDSSVWLAPTLPANRDKHSSLLRTFVNYDRKKFSFIILGLV